MKKQNPQKSNKMIRELQWKHYKKIIKKIRKLIFLQKIHIEFDFYVIKKA